MRRKKPRKRSRDGGNVSVGGEQKGKISCKTDCAEKRVKKRPGQREGMREHFLLELSEL